MQAWQSMCPRRGQPFDALLLIAPVRDTSGLLVLLRVSVHNVTEYQQVVQHVSSTAIQQPVAAATKLPHSLDGLQVLFVDDEADACELTRLSWSLREFALRPLRRWQTH